MDFTFTVWLPRQGEKPSVPSALLIDEIGTKTLFLGILANDTDYFGMYDFHCSAESTDHAIPFPENLLGTAIYRKMGGKLSVVQENGVLIGFLDSLFAR